MIISYDGRGLPNKILNNGVNESYKIDYIGTEEIQVINDGGEDFPEQRFAQGTTVWKYSGWITWFTDRTRRSCSTRLGLCYKNDS